MPEEIKELKEEKKDNASTESKLGSKLCCVSKHSPLVAVIVIIIIVFVVGMALAIGREGARRDTDFGQRFGNKQAFGLNDREFREGMMGSRGMANIDDEITVSGQVSVISDGSVTVKTGSKDVTILVTDQTSYLTADSVAKQSDLKINNSIVATGRSNAAGEITASSISIR